MEIFIDLAQLSATQADSALPGFNLNLLGLVQDKPVPVEAGVLQNQLKTTPDLVLPEFNPALYFDKIKAAQTSFSVKDGVAAFQEAQQNSNTALDSLASYLEQLFTKIETIATNNSELMELIQATSDNRLTEIQSIINNPLNQVTSLEKESSVSVLSDVLTNLVDTVFTQIGTAQGNLDRATFISNQSESAVTSNQLVNNQASSIDLNSQNILNLSETISNFASNMVNGVGTTGTELAKTGGSVFVSPTKTMLPVSVETPRPDFGAASLSALMQMADSTQTIAAAPNILNTTSSQSNTTTVQPAVNQTQPQSQISEGQMGGTVMVGGNSGDTSTVYLMQMLNLMKSGQIKVKIH